MSRNAVLRFGFLVAVMGLFATAALQAAGPYNFYSVTPCRIVDTRLSASPTGGPALAAGTPRNFPIIGHCGVPTGAKAATLNVTLVAPTANGFISIWPYLAAMPTVSTINAAAGEPAIANGAIVPLSADPSLQISVVYGTAGGGTANLLLDVTGYFQ